MASLNDPIPTVVLSVDSTNEERIQHGNDHRVQGRWFSVRTGGTDQRASGAENVRQFSSQFLHESVQKDTQTTKIESQIRADKTLK